MIHEVSANGTYQLEHLDKALQYVPRRRVAIDGGAHVGLWTRILSRAFGTVIAVEPSKDTFDALIWNLNQWGCTNVLARQVALGRTAGTVTMHLDEKQTKRKNTGGRFAAIDGNGEVERSTIDSWRLPDVDFLKLDIEGSELQALEGAVETLQHCRPVVLVEQKGLGERYFGESLGAVTAFLRTHGYRCVQRVGSDEIWRSAR